MKKILMISYYYPPLADVGALRALAFSRYLPELGWEPYVLSVKNPDKYASILGKGKAPSGVKIFYTRSIFHLAWITGKANGLLSRILKLFGIKLTHSLVRDLVCVPDEYIGWIPITILKGLSLIKKDGIDVIYVSCKPFSSSLIGVLLKVITGKPLVLDFRDPISPHYPRLNDPYYTTMPIFPIITRIEKKVLQRADKLILTTEETKDWYDAFFPFVRRKTNFIYNGFFEEYFHDITGEFKEFTIVYSGNFYSQMLAPDPFFEAMQMVINQEPELREKIQFLYVGPRGAWLQAMIDRYGLQGVVRITGSVSREQSIEYISKSSLLLLRIVPGMISTKLFEGLAAGAPFLALIEEGEVARIIRKYCLSTYYITKPDKPAEIGKAIKDGYEKWKKGLLIKMKNKRFHDDFNKRALTEQLAMTLHSLVPDPICTVGDVKQEATNREQRKALAKYES